ncbi:leucyl/phenylalanyl-tRNA--protein transferase [Comamonas composti]|uniref:leucyl/phenylalanyl-tRNA--protein transferase n=1 Tax=Comamonas composti TaxID=408558 RepID=UPI00041DB4E8|nr:leucyl/phenylalanyl-tRNA--protein transferase [Comamonas composti]
MSHPLPWLAPQQPFPPVEATWGADDPIPGLLAAGGQLDAEHLRAAYSQGIFPWFSEGQPTLWWSPDPRMVLQTRELRLHRSLRKSLVRFRQDPECEIRIDSAFTSVIGHCARTPRQGQDGTWIVQAIIDAYVQLHEQGLAHSVETWVGGRLVGGLYCVALGRAVFGESMFAHASDASKIALAALVALCRAQDAPQIDCQQATPHLASLGAREMPRAEFLRRMKQQSRRPAMQWQFDPVYWDELLSRP